MEFLLTPRNVRSPLFYGPPKMYKLDCPFRPIVSKCDGPTDYFSSYITHVIPHLASNLPPVPPNGFLVTNDVTSLYTNISHDDGIKPVIHFMEEKKQLLLTNCQPGYIVLSFLNSIPKHRTFDFIDTHIHQFLGTSMGTRMVPPTPFFL